MRDKSQKACQFVSLLIRFACVSILFLVTSAIRMTNQAQTQQQGKPTYSASIPEPASQAVRMSPALLRGDRVNGVSQKLGSMGTFQTLLVLHLANGLVLLICFFSLGIKNPLKWFQQTRMKNMK